MSTRRPGGFRPLRPLGAALAVVLAVASFGCAATMSEEERQVLQRQADSKRNLGVDHLANGRVAMAIRDLRHAQSMKDDDPVTLHALGEAYRRRGLLDDAYGHLIEALEHDPGGHEIRLSLCGLLVQTERFEEAIDQAQLLVDDPTFPSPWHALNNKGWAHMRLGQTAEARQAFKDALEFKPRYWPARLNLGILENQEGHRVEAVAAFEQVLERDPGKRAEAEVNFRLGEVYVTLGRRAKALEHFKVAAERTPDGRWGQQAQDYLKLLR